MLLAAKIVYYASWLCLTVFLAMAILAVPFLLGLITGVDDDAIALAGIPAGAVLFYPLSRRLLRLRALHLFNIAAGLVGAAVAIPIASRKFAESDALTGVAGPFSGLGDVLAGAALVVVATLCGLLFLAGLAGWYLTSFRGQSPP